MASNQHSREELYRLDTAMDLTQASGLEMSAAFERHIEKVIKPLYPKDAKVRRNVYTTDAGVRRTQWYFEKVNKDAADAVQEAVEKFRESWYDNNAHNDAQGNPVPNPMDVSALTTETFRTTKGRILNPHTAASISRQVVEAGGTYSKDKNTGVSTRSVPESAVTPDGKPLYKSLWSQEREGNKKYMEGRVSLSTIADGGSPATPEERATSMSKRNHRMLIAKYKAMTPKQEYEELRLRLARRGRQAGHLERYEKKHPDDPLVKARRDRTRKIKNNRRATMAKNAAGRTIAVIAGAVMMAVGTLLKIWSSVVEVAGALRKRQSDAARYNLPAKDMQKFINIENGMPGLEKGTFANVFGTLMQFSDPAMPSFAGGIEKAAALLQKDVPDLLGFINKTTRHPDQMMYELLADFLNITASKRGGVLQRGTVSEAQAVNQKMVADIFGDRFAELFLRVYEKFGEAAIEGRSFTATQVKDKLEGSLKEKPLPAPPPFKESAAEEGVKALGELKSLWEGIKHNIFTHLLAHISEIVAHIRNIARAVIGEYNPQWAAAEDAAAKAQALKDTQRMEANIRGHEQSLMPYMRKSKYKDSVSYIKEVERINRQGDVEAITKNLGLSWEEFQELIAVNGFAMENARKLKEIQDNSSVKMGKLTDQTAWTGGTSDAEMASSADTSYFLMLRKFRNMAAADTTSMFNNRLLKPGSIAQYDGAYVLSTLQINREVKDLLVQVEKEYEATKGPNVALRGGPYLSDLLPALIKEINSTHSPTQAASALKAAGVTFDEIQELIAYIQSRQPDERPRASARDYNPFGERGAVGMYNLRKSLIDELSALAQYINIPDYTPVGNTQAAAMMTRAQEINAAHVDAATIRQYVLDELVAKYGLSWAAASDRLATSSTGRVVVPAGSDRELKFEIVVNGMPNGAPAVVRGTVANKGGTSGVHVMRNGDLIIKSVTEAFAPTQP